MNYRAIIIGAGGMGRELYCALRRHGHDPYGFIDDSPSAENLERLARLGSRHLGPVDACLTLRKPYFVAIGNSATRAQIDQRLRAAGVITAPAFIDPSAVLGQDIVVGEGSIICANATVTTNVRIGRCVIINNGCSVSHDVTLGDHATLAPLCSVCGHATIENGAELGTSVSVLPRRKIGAWAMLGAGAVVTRDILPRSVAVGVPARAIKIREMTP